MKFTTISTTLSVALVSIVAANAMAANPNGPKPKCPMGQLPVLENGGYHCEEAKINSNSAPSRQKAGAPTRGGVQAKIILPDYTITGAKRKPGTTDTFIVQVKNQGNAPAPQGTMFGVHYLASNQSWGAGAIIPPLAVGQTKAVTISIPPTNYTRGDRMLFTADYFKQLPESNENNNAYATNYK